MAFGNRDPAFYYSDFDIRLPGLAPRKACHSPSGTPWVVLKAKRAVRELPDGALIEKCLVVPLAPESHCHFVGAGLRSSFTHLIREASPTGGTGGISIGTRVRYRRDHNSIAVDVDVGRRRPAPGETRCIYSAH